MGYFLLLPRILYFLFIKSKIINPFKEGFNENPKTKEPYNSKVGNSNIDSCCKEKGELFEKFIAKKFKKDFFTILEWRSDKYIDGQYALSNKLPDLEVQFKINEFNKKFAIECKYRKGVTDNQIKIAKDYQLQNYKNFESERKIPVYIALGLGGKATDPNELFLIPLKYVQNNILSYRYLTKYKRKVDSQFFYDINDDILK